MKLDVELRDEIASALAQQAAAAGKDLPQFAADVLAERAVDKFPAGNEQASHEDFMASLRRIITMHRPTNGQVDDGRDSIHAGRGECRGRLVQPFVTPRSTAQFPRHLAA